MRDGWTDRRTDRRTEWNQYTPQQLRCVVGIIMSKLLKTDTPYMVIWYKIWSVLWVKPLRQSDAYMHQSTSYHLFRQCLVSWPASSHFLWTNAGILLVEPSGTNFSGILIEIHTFSFKKMHVKMSGKCCHFVCASMYEMWENVLTF